MANEHAHELSLLRSDPYDRSNSRRNRRCDGRAARPAPGGHQRIAGPASECGCRARHTRVVAEAGTRKARGLGTRSPCGLSRALSASSQPAQPAARLADQQRHKRPRVEIDDIDAAQLPGCGAPGDARFRRRAGGLRQGHVGSCREKSADRRLVVPGSRARAARRSPAAGRLSEGAGPRGASGSLPRKAFDQGV
jgi:hypothetical protein